jgi:ferredoxin
LSIPEKGNLHVRTKSDMILSSTVMDLTKSALIKKDTEEGRIRFQLPKDNFMILMNCSLGECADCLVVVGSGSDAMFVN